MKAFRLSYLCFCILILACGSNDDDGPESTDTTPPTISINTVASDDIISANEIANFTISGRSDAEDGQKVTISLYNYFETITAEATVTNGSWVSENLNLVTASEGPYILTATVNDKAGNVSDSVEKNISLNIKNLIFSIDTPIALDNLINNPESKVSRVSGGATFPNNSVLNILYTDEQNSLIATGSLTNESWRSNNTDISSLEDGEILIVAAIQDQDGNRAHRWLSSHLDKTSTPPEPIMEGTIWESSTIATDQDETRFSSIVQAGQRLVNMFDKRVDQTLQLNAWIYTATLTDGKNIEFFVNPEFSQAEGLIEATYYAREIGRLPKGLLERAEIVLIHKGDETFSGYLEKSSNEEFGVFEVYTDHAESEVKPGGFMNELLIHEAVHVSLDVIVDFDDDWEYAQAADGSFISEYAKDNPLVEDAAESYLMYLAYKYRPSTISEEVKASIEAVMSHRIAYFDKLNLELSPFIK